MGLAPRVREIAISAAWHAGEIPSRLVTTDGQAIEVVHRGAWSHGLGPDFRDALILFDGRELRAGDIEIHLRTRGWHEHGHHLNPAYDGVILHIVAEGDDAPTRRHDGALVPVVVVGSPERFALPELAGWDWDRVGGESCAVALATTQPQRVRETLSHLGDTRLATRAARLEARLETDTPGQILWEELLDGLGFVTNRAPMRILAQLARLQQLEDLLQTVPATDRLTLAAGILLGAAGFLPLSGRGASRSTGSRRHRVARSCLEQRRHAVVQQCHAAHLLATGAGASGEPPCATSPDCRRDPGRGE